MELLNDLRSNSGCECFCVSVGY